MDDNAVGDTRRRTTTRKAGISLDMATWTLDTATFKILDDAVEDTRRRTSYTMRKASLSLDMATLTLDTATFKIVEELRQLLLEGQQQFKFEMFNDPKCYGFDLEVESFKASVYLWHELSAIVVAVCGDGSVKNSKQEKFPLIHFYGKDTAVAEFVLKSLGAQTKFSRWSDAL